MIAFRQADPRYPFLWEESSQPAGRWHSQGEGPAHYFSDTPDGAWAELLRHEEIREVEDVHTIRRALWAVEIPNGGLDRPVLSEDVLTGGRASYLQCQKEATALRRQGATGLIATSAALLPGEARGYRVDGGLKPGPPRAGSTLVLFGPRHDLVAWRACERGFPGADLLPKVRHF